MFSLDRSCDCRDSCSFLSTTVPRRLSACQQGRRPIAGGPVSTAARAAAEDNGGVRKNCAARLHGSSGLRTLQLTKRYRNAGGQPCER